MTVAGMSKIFEALTVYLIKEGYLKDHLQAHTAYLPQSPIRRGSLRAVCQECAIDAAGSVHDHFLKEQIALR